MIITSETLNPKHCVLDSSTLFSSEKELVVHTLHHAPYTLHHAPCIIHHTHSARNSETYIWESRP